MVTRGLDRRLGRVGTAVLTVLLVTAGQAPAVARAAEATITAVTSLTNPSTYGSPITFSATVTSAGGTPTGTVQFAADGANLGGPVGLAGGSALSSSIASLAVGVHTVTATYVPDDATFDGSSGSLEGGQAVNAAALTVTANDTSRPYGAADPPFTATIGGFVNGEVLETSGVSGSASCTTTATSASPQGTYPITCTVGTLAAANYAFTTFVDGTLTVEPAGAASVSVNGGTFPYSGTAHAATGFAYGNGGIGDVLSPAVTFSYVGTGGTVYGPTATPPTDAGSYTATASFAGNGVYGSASANASLTIAPTPLTVTPADKSKTVGQVFTAFTGTIAGLVSGDSITPTYGSAGAPASAAVGTYPIVATLVDPGGRLTNYSVTLNIGTLAVLPVPPVTTAVELTSGLNPAPPRQPVTLTATVGGIPSARGTVRLQSSPDGAAWSDAGGPFSVTALGSTFGATFAVTMPAAVQTIRYRAVFTSDDPAIAGSTSPELTQVVAKAAATVALSAVPEAWEVSIPVTIRATIAPASPGVTARAGGTMDISIDDGPASTVPVVDGVAELPATTLAEGSHTVTATYSGDESFLGGATASLTRTVAANVVNASGVGVSGTSVYPVRDGWWDTVAIRGRRNERLGVTIRIYGPAGKLLTTRRIAAGAGPYSTTWNGRTTAGTILPAGKYRIVQTLVDPSTAPALTKTWTSTVTLSPRRMTWKTATFVVTPGPRNYRFSSGQGVGSSSTSSAGALVLAGTDGGWPAVGYEFRLPQASTYREIRFQILGSASGLAPTVGLQRWSIGAAWGQVYRADFGRTAVAPSTTTWRGLSSKSPAPFVSATRRVRGYVDGGGRLTGPFRFGMTGVRLVVVYGILG